MWSEDIRFFLARGEEADAKSYRLRGKLQHDRLKINKIKSKRNNERTMTRGHRRVFPPPLYAARAIQSNRVDGTDAAFN